MKMPRAWAVTVRRSNGEMVSRSGDVIPWSERWPLLKLPLLRGPAILGQMMGLGMRSLFFATDVLAADEKAAQGEQGAAQGPTVVEKASSVVKNSLTLGSLLLLSSVTNAPDGSEADDSPEPAPAGAPAADDSLAAGNSPVLASAPVPEKGLSAGELALSIGMAVAMFLLVFKALPLGIAWLAGWAMPALQAPLAESVISGVALAGVFVGYLWLLSRFPDIKRMFMYHGAEHELVHVHEKGLAWSVENAREQPTQHPRCGTSFLFFVVLTSIVVWSLFPIDAGFLGKLGLRLALLPLVMGLSFELIRLSARHRRNPFFRALMAPGLWSQGITTKKPDDSMREVSIRSLELASGRQPS